MLVGTNLKYNNLIIFDKSLVILILQHMMDIQKKTTEHPI